MEGRAVPLHSGQGHGHGTLALALTLTHTNPNPNPAGKGMDERVCELRVRYRLVSKYDRI